MDIKAGYLNIRLAEGCEQYCGIITQDGVWKYKVMAFGYLGAPATFQAIVEDILAKIEGGVQARVYIDDIHPHGNDINKVW
jgi:hypothetical protein